MKTNFLILISLSIFLLRCSPKREELPTPLEENSIVSENKKRGHNGMADQRS